MKKSFKKIGLCAIALILCLVVSVCAFGCRANEPKLPKKDENGYYTLPEATFYYNITKESGTSSCFSPPDGYFQEPLDKEELEQLVPDGRFPCIGMASWNGDGQLLSVWVDLEVDNRSISVSYSANRDARLDIENFQITKCNGAMFVVKQFYDDDGATRLHATGVVHGQYISVQAWCINRDPESIRAAFEKAVRWMAICNAMEIDATTVQYSQIPEYYELELTLSEAYDDPTFGHMLPQKLPTGLGRKSIIRRKKFATDFLSVHLGNSQNKSLHLNWQVHHFTEADADELIPSAEVTPESVKEMYVPTFRVEDLTVEILDALGSDLYYVKIGDYKIRISSSGISPEDMYDLLQQVRGNE